MKYPAFFLIFATVFLASCTFEKQEEPEELSSIISAERQQEMQENQESVEAISMNGELSEENSTEEKLGENTIENMSDIQTLPVQQEVQEKQVATSEGIYTNYDISLVGKTEYTVLFFHATWCPSCRAADTKILSETIPENLTILKTDYDSQTELKKKYGIVTQHTFVLVDADGNMIKKWVGGTSISDITEKL